jgi:hypothetical protein
MDIAKENERQIEEAIVGHDARNSSLRRLLLNKNVDTKMSRPIDLHFWVASPADAEALADALRSRGMAILAQRKAATADAGLPWNVEARIEQSVELTIGSQFTEELVRLAIAHNGRYDGWGTQI